MILIIAKGANYNFLNQMRVMTSSEQVFHDYGRASELSFACDRFFELGQTECCVCNVQCTSDYFEIVEQIHNVQAEYVLLPGLRLDNKLTLKDGRTLPVALILSELLVKQHFILTDYHASQFKNMSHFLAHYNKWRLDLDQIARHKENLILVVNNLRESDDSSIDLACSLLDTAVGQYPLLECGKAYYDLEVEDFYKPIVFFRQQLAVNLFNLDVGIESNIIVQRMVRALDNEILDTVGYLIGTRFTRNTLFTVHSLVDKTLSMREGSYYRKYRLIDITIKNYSIIVDIDVYPYFTKDAIRTQVTIEGI